MKIYLNVSCLNRPFDDQGQARIRLEAEAVAVVLEKCEKGEWIHVTSGMAQIEIDANPDRKRRRRVGLLLPDESAIMQLTEAVLGRASELTMLGFKPADATHVAAAESIPADVLLSCDDRF